MRKQLEDPDLQNDISGAIDAIQTVLDSANDAIDKEHLATAFTELDERVDDWKSLKIDSFGALLRYGTYSVVKGDNGKDSEREVSLLPSGSCWTPFSGAVERFPSLLTVWARRSTIFTYSNGFFSAARISTPTNKRPS